MQTVDQSAKNIQENAMADIFVIESIHGFLIKIAVCSQDIKVIPLDCSHLLEKKILKINGLGGNKHSLSQKWACPSARQSD